MQKMGLSISPCKLGISFPVYSEKTELLIFHLVWNTLDFLNRSAEKNLRANLAFIKGKLKPGKEKRLVQTVNNDTLLSWLQH